MLQTARQTVLILVRALILTIVLTGLAGAAPQDDYMRGVSSFKSLLANEKRAALRAEWLAVQKHFEKSLAAQPKGEYAPNSMYFLGRIHEEMGRRSHVSADRKNALDAFDRLLATWPKHDWADDALYRKGLIWQEQLKDREKAAEMFRAVQSTYPKGNMAAEAGTRLAGLQAKAADKPEKSTPPKTPASKTGKQSSSSAPNPMLTGIRHWSSDEYTRVVMDMTADVRYERALVESSANGNKQLRIVLQQAGIDAGVMASRSIQDGILSQIHVGTDAAKGAVIRVDLMQMDHYRIFTLPDPYRVVLDIYGKADKTGRTAAQAAPSPAAQDAPAASSKAAPTEDPSHVAAALTDLQAGQEAKEPARAPEQKKSASQPAKSAAAQKTPEPKPSKTKASSKESAAIPAEPQPATPDVQVSAKQKKYAGSLVEQLGLKVRTIMIDPGHGGKDPGAMANGVREKDVNLRAATMLGRILRERGFEVHFTRTTDKFIPLEERTAMANAKNADLFISIHCNAYKDASIKGFEVYYLSLATDAQAVRVAARENGVSAKKISDMQFILSDLMLNSKINESRQMATLIDKATQQSMRSQYSMTSHGSKGAFFYVLTGARMPAILVELGYVTHPTEAAQLNSDAYLNQMARGLADGIVAYKQKLEKFAINPSGKS